MNEVDAILKALKRDERDEDWTSQMNPEGWEKYFSFSDFPDDATKWRGMELQCILNDGRDTPFILKSARKNWKLYGNFSYYRSNLYSIIHEKYIFVCAPDMTHKRCLIKIGENHAERLRLCVNDKGIFVIGCDNKENGLILWYSHEGRLLKRFQMEGRLKCSYLCGTLFYYILEERVKGRKEDFWKYGSAYWMDLADGVKYNIFQGDCVRYRSNRALDGNYIKSDAACIMGNEKGAVIRIEFWADNSNIENDSDRLAEAFYIGGWYYYSHEKKQLFCLSDVGTIGPHTMLQDPVLTKKWSDQFRWNEKKCSDYRRIVAFNMEKNLMWVSGKEGGKECWGIPMDITPAKKPIPRLNLPVWEKDPARLTGCKRPYYFDGENMYCLDMPDDKMPWENRFCSINAAGRVERWPFYIGDDNEAEMAVMGDHVYVGLGARNNSDNCEELGLIYFTHVYVCLPAGHVYRGVTHVIDTDKENKEDYKLIEAFEENARAKKVQTTEIKPKAPIAQEEPSVSGQTSPVKAGHPGYVGYWQGLNDYMERTNWSAQNPKARVPQPGDHNWHAIRLGSAVFRIECAVSFQKGTMRAGFFVKNSPGDFATLEGMRWLIDSNLKDLGSVVWDSLSQSANVSVYTSLEDKSLEQQYRWFCQTASKLLETIFPYYQL